MSIFDRHKNIYNKYIKYQTSKNATFASLLHFLQR